MCQTILEENVYWLSNEHRTPYIAFYVSVFYFTKTRSNLLWFWWLQNLAVHTNTYMLHDQLFLILSHLFIDNAIALPVLKFIFKQTPSACMQTVFCLFWANKASIQCWITWDVYTNIVTPFRKFMKRKMIILYLRRWYFSCSVAGGCWVTWPHSDTSRNLEREKMKETVKLSCRRIHVDRWGWDRERERERDRERERQIT